MSDDDFLYGNASFYNYFSYAPTDAPTFLDSEVPTELPSLSSAPSVIPSLSPSQSVFNSSDVPSTSPSASVTISPTSELPTLFPTYQPTVNPTNQPSVEPTFASTVSPSTLIPTAGTNATIAPELGSHHHPDTQIAIIIVSLFIVVCVLIALLLRFHEQKDRTAARRSNIRYAEYLGEDFEGDESGGNARLVQMPVYGGTSSNGTWARPPTGAGGMGGDVPTAIGVIGGQSVRRTKYSVVDPAAMDRPTAAGGDRGAAAAAVGGETVEPPEEASESEYLERGEVRRGAAGGTGWSKYETGNPMNPFV